MIDDLISRNKIMEEAKELSDSYTGEGWDNWGVYALIERQPSVRAVPLDDLCKFLGKATHPCILLAIGCPYDESNCEECDSCNAWKATLTKWMEEQNEVD